MKNTTKIALSTLTMACIALIGAGSTSAFSGLENNRGIRNNPKLVPPEMRKEFREDLREKLHDMTKEERKEWKEKVKEQHKEVKQERIAALEEFTGLTKEELKDARKEGKNMGGILEDQGKTKEEAETFLTEQANKRVDLIVENHNLTAEQEQTLRDRIATFVQRILERWFGTK